MTAVRRGTRLGLILGVVVFALSGCGSSGDDRSSKSACVVEGSPVSLEQLVDTSRENGVSLEPNTQACEFPLVPDATNMGPDGISSKQSVVEREGRVLCFLRKEGDSTAVQSTHHPGDQETRVAALNVRCTVYPSAASQERMQIERVKRALRQLVAANR